MPNVKAFLSQTRQTALFALREYFRPLVIVTFFLKSRLASAKPVESAKGFPRRKDTPQKSGQRELGEAPVSEQQ